MSVTLDGKYSPQVYGAFRSYAMDFLPMKEKICENQPFVAPCMENPLDIKL